MPSVAGAVISELNYKGIGRKRIINLREQKLQTQFKIQA